MKHFDWSRSVAYDSKRKREFHYTARARLRALAKALNLTTGTYDLRSNQGGIAVSGEVILHTDNLYIQASQSSMGNGMGILLRTCKGRDDYHGGTNNWLPLAMLDNTDLLARYVRNNVLAKAA